MPAIALPPSVPSAAAGPSSHANGAPNGDAKAKNGPKSKNAKRRAKRKDERAASETPAPSDVESDAESASSRSTSVAPAPPSLDLSSLSAPAPDDPAYATWLAVSSAFSSASGGVDPSDPAAPSKGDVIYSDDDQLSDSDADDDGAREAKAALSKRKLRRMQRLTVAELKQMVPKPELVEGADVTANDPRLLLQLKATRNAVPVPPHWSQKRAYLQNKRGVEKPPYLLPAYIAATGIAEMKDALKEKEADQSLKAKTRERVQPKMGKIDIDYQKLHDAFFRFQTKPESLTRYGETYYEGKEFETKFKERRPGDLSEDLKEALSIPPLAPPPWLIAMQRFGPPPSYPHLKIAGLNAPIPEGAQWGFHPGGWGRPPMDEFGRPIYAEVMGTDESAAAQAQQEALGEPINREPWGELEPEEEEEEEDDEEEEEEQDEEEQDDGPADGLETPLPSGLETPGGFQSVTSTVPGGLETPDFLELRKGARGAPSTRAGTAETEDRGPRSLYHVVPEMQRQGGSGFMPSDRGYDLSGIARQGAPVLGEERGVKRKQGDVDLALAPEELESLSKEELAARYDAARAKKDRFKF